MAETKTRSKKNNELTDNVQNNETKENISTVIENEINKTIENSSKELQDNVAIIKAQEEDLMKKIEENPEKIQEIVEKEIKNVDESIKKVTEKIENMSENIKNKKVFFTTNNWNGWGYGS